MITFEMNEKDAVDLVEILQTYLQDLKTERVRTDNREYHYTLVGRERFVCDMISRLEHSLR
ncbi:hypothetical protein [Geomonas sp.]|uniref:hypothetical protein n=1 Tax=Geomonas sp. TaxID=2651584 RepID=UPI002B49E1D6|nr:hypothetical protein [Geomonas sp.]HJV34029.1 hypothetical protein [Geomonas sp.]